MTGLQPIHREDDGELVGYLSAEQRDGAPCWVARALFGAALRAFADRDDAAGFLRAHGLALLAERWWYRAGPEQEWQPVFLMEARLGAVRVRFGDDPAVAEVAVLRDGELDGLRLRPDEPIRDVADAGSFIRS